MADEPIQQQPTKTSFVYDTRTGQVVHVHQFIPYAPEGTCSDSEMEETALHLAPGETANLGVVHYEGDRYADRSVQYRVDCEKRTLIEEPLAEAAALDPASFRALQK